ncbi:MAG: hypothetical protein ACC657_14665 [Thiohalomonadales bacterium]
MIIDGIFNLGKLYQDFMIDPKSTNPSHTQLAKDYSKHPLHPLVIRLAEVAVKDIATIMHQIWFEGKNDFKCIPFYYRKHRVILVIHYLPLWRLYLSLL